MSYAEMVKSTLYSDIHEMSDHVQDFVLHPGKDFVRNRKLGFETFMDLFLSMGSDSIGHELIKYFDHDADSVPCNSAFCQQQDKLSENAFRYLLRQFNSHFPLTEYNNKYHLIACDGSEFNIARNPDDPETFHEPNGKSSLGFNMLHTISFFDIPSKRYLDVIIQPGRKKNEYQAICDLLDRYSYGGTPIFVADRGFSSYNVFAHAMENGYFFAIRAKDINTRRLLGVSELPDYIDTTAEVILSRSQSKKKRLQPDRACDYRYICKNITFDYITPDNPEYDMKLRIVRFDLGNGSFENIITNLPQDEFPSEEIKNIYWCRWSIETSFRDLKHSIGTTNFHSKKVSHISKEIWARMILFNFCSIITMHCVTGKHGKKHPHQVNFSNAMKICHDFLQMKNKSPDIKGLINKYTLPIRPGRNYARQHRFQLPASFAYRFC
jgi:hypothetical protein